MEDDLEVSPPRYIARRHHPTNPTTSTSSSASAPISRAATSSASISVTSTASAAVVASTSAATASTSASAAEEDVAGSWDSRASSGEHELFRSSSGLSTTFSSANNPTMMHSSINTSGSSSGSSSMPRNSSVTSFVRASTPREEKTDEKSYTGGALSWIWQAMTGGTKDAEQEEADEFAPNEQLLPKVEDLGIRTMQTEKKSTYSQQNQPRREKNVSTELPDDSHPISALLLAYWDNVKGPTIQKVWKTKHEHHEDVLQHVARHTLSDEILRPYSDNCEPKFYVLGDFGVVSASFVFAAKTNHNKYSLSILSPLSAMPLFLGLYSIIENRVPILLDRFRAVQGKPHGLEKLSKLLIPFVIDIQQLEHTAIPSDIMVADTLFSDENQHLFEPNFVRRAITSHLQTHGVSVVIGTDLNLINIFVRSLGLFLNSEERRRSRLATENGNYMADLMVQGILIKGDLSEQVGDHNLIESKYPSTLIDVSSLTVQQTSEFHEYTLMRQEFLKSELKESSESSLWVAPNGMLRSVKEIAPFVNKLITEVSQLTVALRTAYIHESVRLLNRKAIALIKYAEIEIGQQHKPSPNQEELFLQAATLRKIRQDLSLNDNHLFFTVLATAEKLKEGSFEMIIGDPHIMEEKFREMIESF